MPVCAYVEMTDGLQPHGPAWEQFAQAIGKCRPDILLMNEMPFGQWLARKNDFVVEDAQQSVEIHEAGTAALAALNIPAVITSRPMLLADRLANEAIVIEDGEVRPLAYEDLPSAGAWLVRGVLVQSRRWALQHPEYCGLGVGVLLCTELMFNEHARQYGRCGADLIAVPRATGSAHGKLVNCRQDGFNRLWELHRQFEQGRAFTDSPRFGGGGFPITPGAIWLGGQKPVLPSC
ncbi:carbon-nitrogen hydrolase family protein [Phyllobacterium endophyticum]|uniref:carbon-nitrogen hydrolase family protein n=1 Tax=Phyllobacterium endophyticum TaxID=1149773 RepID=UPI001FEF650D|nr:carbon-nitrogen hydrolase family protein [Phyllobacterium endophyticum]